MSSILKALEKAEESNSPKRMASESDLIRSRRSRPTWVMPVAVLCGAGLATLVTFAAMGGFSRHAPAAALPAVVAKTGPVVVAPLNPVPETPAPASEQAVPSAPAAPPEAGEPLETIAVPSSKIAPVSKLKTVPVLKLPAVPVAILKAPLGSKAVTPANGKARAAAARQPASAQPATVQAAPAQAASVVLAAPAAPAAPVAPELKVSGIAWQGKGESSFAVVNGRAVLQGGTVDGYKVLEIHQDVVKFSHGNGVIEVPVGGDDK